MKNYIKIIFLISALLTITLTSAYAEKPNVNTEQVTQAPEVTAGSVYTDAKEGVAAVHQDVKEAIPVLYQDVKGALQSLAGPLKVGAEHVYGILVKQQVVKSITWLTTVLSLLLIGIPLFIWGIKNGNKSGWKDGDEIAPVFGGIISAIGILIFLFTINTIVSGFVNPEYGAIKEILSVIKR